MTDREAMEMALKALEEKFTSGNSIPVERATITAEEYQALRQALAQPEQEPVAWVKEGKVRVGFGRIEERKYVQFDQTLPVGTKLYAAPPSKQEPDEYDAPALYKAKAEREKAEKQGPVAKVVARISNVRAEIHPSLPVGTELYTAPPSKPWVSLTDDDRIEIFNSMDGGIYGFLKTWGWLNFSKELEAKLKEKNNG